MPSQAALSDFVSLIERGEFIASMERFMTPDATQQENLDPPRAGLETLLAHEHAFLATIKSVRVTRNGPLFVAGDHVIIDWVFAFEFTDGSKVNLDELACQTWRGDKLTAERFYYDPKQMR